MIALEKTSNETVRPSRDVSVRLAGCTLSEAGAGQDPRLRAERREPPSEHPRGGWLAFLSASLLASEKSESGARKQEGLAPAPRGWPKSTVPTVSPMRMGSSVPWAQITPGGLFTVKTTFTTPRLPRVRPAEMLQRVEDPRHSGWSAGAEEGRAPTSGLSMRQAGPTRGLQKSAWEKRRLGCLCSLCSPGTRPWTTHLARGNALHGPALPRGASA